MESEMIRDSEIKAIKRILNIVTWVFLIPTIIFFCIFISSDPLKFYEPKIPVPRWAHVLFLALIGGIVWFRLRAFYFRDKESKYGYFYELWIRIQKDHVPKSISTKFIYRIIFPFIYIAIVLSIGFVGYYIIGNQSIGILSLPLASWDIFILRSYILDDMHKLVNPESALADKDDEE